MVRTMVSEDDVKPCATCADDDKLSKKNGAKYTHLQAWRSIRGWITGRGLGLTNLPPKRFEWKSTQRKRIRGCFSKHNLLQWFDARMHLVYMRPRHFSFLRYGYLKIPYGSKSNFPCIIYGLLNWRFHQHICVFSRIFHMLGLSGTLSYAVFLYLG